MGFLTGPATTEALSVSVSFSLLSRCPLKKKEKTAKAGTKGKQTNGLTRRLLKLGESQRIKELNHEKETIKEMKIIRITT